MAAKSQLIDRSTDSTNAFPALELSPQLSRLSPPLELASVSLESAHQLNFPQHRSVFIEGRLPSSESTPPEASSGRTSLSLSVQKIQVADQKSVIWQRPPTRSIMLKADSVSDWVKFLDAAMTVEDLASLPGAASMCCSLAGIVLLESDVSARWPGPSGIEEFLQRSLESVEFSVTRIRFAALTEERFRVWVDEVRGNWDPDDA